MWVGYGQWILILYLINNFAQFLGLGADLVNLGKNEHKQVIFVPCNLSFYQKKLLFSTYWKNALLPKMELLCQSSLIKIFITSAQVVLLKSFWHSWFLLDWDLSCLWDTSLVHDVFIGLFVYTCDLSPVINYNYKIIFCGIGIFFRQIVVGNYLKWHWVENRRYEHFNCLLWLDWRCSG